MPNVRTKIAIPRLKPFINKPAVTSFSPRVALRLTLSAEINPEIASPKTTNPKNGKAPNNIAATFTKRLHFHQGHENQNFSSEGKYSCR